MDIETQKRILLNVIRKMIPPGIVYYQCLLKSDFSYLIHIIMRDGTGIYGYMDENDHVWLLDPWEWLEKGGLQALAYEHNIETVEAIE